MARPHMERDKSMEAKNHLYMLMGKYNRSTVAKMVGVSRGQIGRFATDGIPLFKNDGSPLGYLEKIQELK